MGATTQDLFGATGEAEPATPGSYGEPPPGYRLPEATRLGPVCLQVRDLRQSLLFYEGTLGLRVVARGGARAAVAAHGDDRPLVELQERPGVRLAAPGGRFGLYHFALRLPDRAALGRFVRHLAGPRARVGAGDHLVSEALYLHDPDGLGVEVYADRPRSVWRRIGRELMIATDPLDLADVARSAGDRAWAGMPAGTAVGHVHLHVGSLEHAAAFFSDALGFDRMTWRYPGALFFGAGGYHHHVGANTWAGSGARAPEPDEVRLLEWTIELPDAASLAGAAASLSGAGHRVESAGAAAATRDPWGTAIRLQVPGTGEAVSSVSVSGTR
jgi:catechol 2,3-dioxygenase